MPAASHLHDLLSATLGNARADTLLDHVRIVSPLVEETGGDCSRAVMAEALNIVLLARLLDTVPSAQAYFSDLCQMGRRLDFDHGALRTVDLAGMGTLPGGETAITRILLPLGYDLAETYPLDRLGMTGRAYRHADYPEDIPQFFVSELHLARFPASFREAAARVTGTSRDPLAPQVMPWLDQLADRGRLPLAQGRALLPVLAGCFGRQHAVPADADYRLLLQDSPEMAWIATEGNAFNHATDRITGIEALAARQRALGRPMKDAVEVSASGRVRQTAYRADAVVRSFVGEDGHETAREVPGSFFEFIERDCLPGSTRLDLSFDTGNAQGIFRMTATPQG